MLSKAFVMIAFLFVSLFLEFYISPYIPRL